MWAHGEQRCPLHRWIRPCSSHRGPGRQLQRWKDSYLLTLLLEECRSRREFQRLGAKGKDCFGCFELRVVSSRVRVLRLSSPLVGSLRAGWSLSADLPGSSAIVEWVSDNFQRVWNLAEYFSLWNTEVMPAGRSWRPGRYAWYKNWTEVSTLHLIPPYEHKCSVEDSFRVDVVHEEVDFAGWDWSLLPLSTVHEWDVRGKGTGGAAASLFCAWQPSEVTASGASFGASLGNILSKGVWESPLQFLHFSGAQIWIPDVWGFEETISHYQLHKSTRLLNLGKLLLGICKRKCCL